MFFLRYYADFEDDEGRRQPAFDTDIFPARDPEELRKTCEFAAEEHPDLTYLILDEDLRVIDVFGRLSREQWEAIDPNQVYEQARGEDGGKAGDSPVESVSGTSFLSEGRTGSGDPEGGGGTM